MTCILPWNASRVSTLGRSKTVIYVYIRLTDAPFYHFILNIIKKEIVFFSLFSAVTHILDILVKLLQAAQ